MRVEVKKNWENSDEGVAEISIISENGSDDVVLGVLEEAKMHGRLKLRVDYDVDSKRLVMDIYEKRDE